MPRSANGTYNLPAGNPVVGGTYITTAWANPTMEDIAAALTDSLSRSGQGGMSVPFKNADGNSTSPGITWTNEPNTGFYRAAASDMRASVGGYDRMRWNSAGVQLWTGTVWTPVLSQAQLDAALVDYTQNAGDETISGDWTFEGDIRTTGLVSATNLAFTIGSTVRGVFSAAGLDVTGVASQGGVALALSTRSITGATSLQGGGNLTADRTITLLNDVAGPGASWYYGTNSSGVKGWNPLSGVVGVPEAPIDGTSYARNNASWVPLASGGAYLPTSGGTMTGQITLPGGGTGLQAIAVSESQTMANAAVAAHVALADPHTQYLLKTGGAISGALTIGTTLGVTGASTVAALTASGLVLMNIGGQIRAGNALAFYDTTNANNKNLSLNNTSKEIVRSAAGAMFHWFDTNLTYGNVRISTTTPAATGNPGDIVFVYE